MPNLSPQPIVVVTVTVGRTERRLVGQIKAKTLGDAHGRTDCHPSLMQVPRALQIPTHKKQALNEFEGPSFPDDDLGTEYGPRALEKRLACLVPLFWRTGPLELGGQGEDDIERADKDTLIAVELTAREEDLVGMREAFLIEERLDWLEIPPVQAGQVVGVLAGWQHVVRIPQAVIGVLVTRQPLPEKRSVC